MPDLSGIPVEMDFDTIFGNNTKGKALVSKISDYKFLHHQKKGRSHQDTQLCIPYAVGQPCPKGKGCPKNHCQRKDLRAVAAQRADVAAINTLITDQYQTKRQSLSMLAPINITLNSNSDGVIVYPQSQSPILVVTKPRRTNPGYQTSMPSGGPTSKPSTKAESRVPHLVGEPPSELPSGKPISEPRSKAEIRIPHPVGEPPSGPPIK